MFFGQGVTGRLLILTDFLENNQEKIHYPNSRFAGAGNGGRTHQVAKCLPSRYREYDVQYDADSYDMTGEIELKQ